MSKNTHCLMKCGRVLPANKKKYCEKCYKEAKRIHQLMMSQVWSKAVECKTLFNEMHLDTRTDALAISLNIILKDNEKTKEAMIRRKDEQKGT